MPKWQRVFQNRVRSAEMNENILLVEDEEALRMTIGDRLRGEGYMVDFAADGNQGFDKATTLPFDLVILDVMLPSRKGFVVCRGVRPLGLASRMLILFARDELVAAVVGLRRGRWQCLSNPFDGTG